jgi:hypothetical protein
MYYSVKFLSPYQDFSGVLSYPVCFLPSPISLVPLDPEAHQVCPSLRVFAQTVSCTC